MTNIEILLRMSHNDLLNLHLRSVGGKKYAYKICTGKTEKQLTDVEVGGK
jgi:hypothetical protein